MTADTVQARYEQLDQVAARFAKASASSSELQRNIARCAEVLEHGGWQGLGADAFFAEMHGTLYPAMQRLIKALEQGRATTLQIKEVMRAAEDEASKLFRNQPQGLVANENGGSAVGYKTTFGSILGQPVTLSVDASAQGPYSDGGFGIDRIRGELKSEDWLTKDNRNKHSSELGFKYGVFNGNLASAQAGGNFTVGAVGAAAGITGTAGAYDAGVKVGKDKDGYIAGVYGEATLAKAEAEAMVGSKNLGVTHSYEAKVGSVEAFAGYKDHELGAEIGFTLVSVKEEAGVNIAGVNVGVSGEVGLKWEFGFKIGPKVEAKLPFFSVGFSVGKAKTGHEHDM